MTNAKINRLRWYAGLEPQRDPMLGRELDESLNSDKFLVLDSAGYVLSVKGRAMIQRERNSR